MLDDLHRLTIADLSVAFRRLELSPVDCVKDLLDRIDRVDDRVGASITITTDLALRQARAAERALVHSVGDARPLLGVPVALKDLIETRGVRTTAGSRVLADYVPARDAAVWRRLRRAGAVLIGKANTHEFAYGGTTEPTRNPWDLTRMVGGSSGGSAAAVSAGLVPAAIGSDTAGSVRIPAGFCGVFGLKPSRGLVSRSGVIPLAPTLDVVGPFARTPVDVGLLLDAIAGYDPADEGGRRFQRPSTYRPSPGQELAGVRVGVLFESEPMSRGVHAALKAACTAFQGAGALMGEASIGSIDDATQACFTIIGVEAADWHEHLLEEHRALYTDYVRDRLLEGSKVSAVSYRRAIEEARRVTERCDGAFAEFDLMLAPGMPCPAPAAYVESIEVAGGEYSRDFLLCRNTAFANLSGHPALAVPVGFEAGLPVGVQILGPRRGDALVLQAGQILYERLDSRPLTADPA